jgi:protein-disulfide isomerase
MSHNRSAEASGDPCDSCKAAYNSLTEPPSEQDHRQGSLDAKVVLVEYGDYQCPQCRELYALIQNIQLQLNSSFSDQNDLCLIFRHFPQIEIHPQAQKAAEAAEAAAAQGKFWQMHELLFQHQQNLGDGYLAEYADNLGLDVTQFVRDIARKVYFDRVYQDITSGLNSGIMAAPVLFINGMQYVDRWELDPLMAAIATVNHQF